MKKKLLLLMLAFSMVLPLLSGMTFFAAAYSDSEAQILRGGAPVGSPTSLKTAIANATAGDTVKLLFDTGYTEGISVSKDLTIDGGGNTLTFFLSSGGFGLTVNGNITLKNINIVSDYGGGVRINGGTLNLGVLDDPTSTVGIKAKGISLSNAPVAFYAANTTLNSYYANIEGIRRVIDYSGGGVSGVNANFHNGNYHMTVTESDAEYGSSSESSGGRFMQFSCTNSTLNIYGGAYTSHFGFAFNMTGAGSKVNIYGGRFDHIGDGADKHALFTLKSDVVANIYGGIINVPQRYPAINIDTSSTASLNGYGGTVISMSQKVPVNAESKTFVPFGMMHINAETLSDIDLVDYRPVISTGASVSLDPDAAGIKFTATVPTHAIESINAIKDAGTEPAYGMLIASTPRLQGLPFLNFDAVNVLGLKDTDYADIAAEKKGTNSYGDTTFEASLLGVDERWFATDYSANPYIKFIKDGKTVYVFGNYSGANVRNMKDIAKRALADHDEHGRFTDDELAVLERYADAEYVDGDTSVTRVLSLNVLTTDATNGYTFYAGQSEADYTFAKRLSYIQAMVDYAKPDVMLFQEYSGQEYWGKAITLEGSNGTYTSEQLPGYTWINHGNRRGTLYENNTQTQNAFHAHNFVLFDSAKFEYVASGTRYVSKSGTYDHTDADLMFNNGDGTQAKHDDLGDFTWVVLKDKATGIESIYASIHTYTNGLTSRYAYFLDNLQCVTAYLETVSAAHGDAPVVIGGDFNMPVYGETLQPHYEHLTQVANYRDSYVTGTGYGTARNFGSRTAPNSGSSGYDGRIDYIFVNGADTYGYEALSGQIVGGVYDPFAKIGSTTVASEGYDISDHMPIMTDVTVGKSSKYQAENKADYHKNPDSANDKTVENASGTGSTAEHVLFNNAENAAAVKNLDTKHGAQYIASAIIEDAVKGNVLRIAATDETNYVNTAFAYGEKYTTAMAGYSKLRIIFKTELTYPTELVFAATTGDAALSGGATVAVPTGSDGEWQTVDIDVSALTGELARVGLYGIGQSTGLLYGDAIYIASIELIP